MTTTDSRAVTQRAKDGIAMLDGRACKQAVVMLESLNERCVSEAMVEGLARFLSFGRRMVGCSEVVPQPQLAHTDKNKRHILSCGTILRTNLLRYNDFDTDNESGPGTVYTATRSEQPKFKKCVGKFAFNLNIKTFIPTYMYERLAYLNIYVWM